MIGRSGWAAVNHARENEEGVMVDIRFSIFDSREFQFTDVPQLKVIR